MRVFESGATRSDDKDKLRYEGFLNPLVTKRFCEYMHKHRIQSDGKLRDPDNWQKGMPIPQYLASLSRHIEDIKLHLGGYSQETSDFLEDSICASIFNLNGMLLEVMKQSGRANTSVFDREPSQSRGSRNCFGN